MPFGIVRTEIEVYKMLDPAVRVVILKALCDIRVEVLESYIKIVSLLLHLNGGRYNLLLVFKRRC